MLRAVVLTRSKLAKRVNVTFPFTRIFRIYVSFDWPRPPSTRCPLLCPLTCRISIFFPLVFSAPFFCHFFCLCFRFFVLRKCCEKLFDKQFSARFSQRTFALASHYTPTPLPPLGSLGLPIWHKISLFCSNFSVLNWAAA